MKNILKTNVKKFFISLAGVVFIIGVSQMFNVELGFRHLLFFLTMIFTVLFFVIYRVFIRQEIIFAMLEGEEK